jgi:hypothetical protein
LTTAGGAVAGLALMGWDSAAACPATFSGVAPRQRDKIKVLLLSGQNNHDWQRTTPMMEQILLDADRFDVTVSFAPPAGAPADQWKKWSPAFDQYDCLLSDYNGELWPEPVRDAFLKYMDQGGRLVIQHAANNPFTGWAEYEQMTGLLWRGPEVGYRVYLDAQGQIVRQPPGQGIGAGHGRLHDWQITTREPEHPIFRDMPPVWMQAHDELYHGQRGPAENMHILASAFSSLESGGTGQHELMVWWIPFGRGKAISVMPGHLWPGQADTRALRSVGFRSLLQRATEWVASDQVSIPLPDDFPTANQASVRPE